MIAHPLDRPEPDACQRPIEILSDPFLQVRSDGGAPNWRDIVRLIGIRRDTDLRMVALVRYYPRDMTQFDLWDIHRRAYYAQQGFPSGPPRVRRAHVPIDYSARGRC